MRQNESSVDKAVRTTATATVWIAIFTLVSVGVSLCTFFILRSQLKLLRQQLVGTEAAVMNLNVNADAGGLHVSIVNQGRVTAPASGHFVAKRLLLPSLELIGQPVVCDIARDPVLPKATGPGFEKTCAIPGLGVKEWEGDVRHLQQALAIEVSNASYEDGFGGTNTFPTECSVLMVVGWGILDTGDVIGNVGPVPCSQAAIKYRDVRSQRDRFHK